MAIEIRRGLKADLPASASLGQLLWCTDTGELFVGTGAGRSPILSGATFSGLTSGTNTTSHMTVGTGGTIDHAGTGVVDATAINGVPIPSANSGTAGKIPITQGDGSAAWADPFVQGVYPPGTNTTTGGIAGGPINPVLVGGKGDDGTLHDIATDNTGQVKVLVENSPTVVLGAGSAAIGHVVTDSGSTTVVTGTVAVTQSGVWAVEIEDSGGNKFTSNSAATAGKFGLDVNVLSVLGTAPTTVGKLDIKGADGDVFVRQATGSNLHTVLDSGTLTTITNPVTVTGTVAATQGTSPWTVQGDSASGAANAGNPVKVGGVFNTTQPTVTSGQTVDVQATARGAQIVATGIDTFNVTVNAALPAGGNTIGAVTQASGPWTSNLTQVGGTTVGTAASGVQQVGITGHAAASVDSPTASSVPANALYHGVRAATAYPTAVTDGQMVGAMGDKAGRQVVVTSAPRDLTSGFVLQTTDASSHTLIAAAASTFADISLLVITNETATATVVSLGDGTATYKYAIASNGGAVVPFNPPLPATSANTAWTVTSSAVVTLDFSGTYVKNQ